MIRDNRYEIINIFNNKSIHKDSVYKGPINPIVKYLSINYTHFIEQFVSHIKRIHTFLYIEPIIIIQCL